jgi:Hg(II)-responsive transcriptional regulator
MGSLTIGALARRAGVGVETVRFYERRGLVHRPARPTAGFRTYSEDTVARIRFIRHAQALGFTLKEIAELLALRVAPGSDCAEVRARAVAKLADVEERVAELVRIRSALAKLVASCPGNGAVTSCTILGALAELPGEETRPPECGRTKRRRKGMKTVELKIEGMHCDGCAATIERLLVREAGVKAANVSYAAGKARIFYDPGATELARITAAIEKAGYRVEGDRATSGT